MRAQLRGYERELDKLLAPDGNGPDASDAERSSPHSIWNRIIAYLEEQAPKTFTAPSLTVALQVKNINTVRGTLSRLTAAGKISKAGRGEYTARREDEEEEGAAHPDAI